MKRCRLNRCSEHRIGAGRRCWSIPQPQVDIALAAWRAPPQVAAVLEALADYGAGAPLADDSALAGLLADHPAAAGLVAGFIDPFMQALRAEPLAQLPLGFSAKPGLPAGSRWRAGLSGRSTTPNGSAQVTRVTGCGSPVSRRTQACWTIRPRWTRCGAWASYRAAGW
jgi:hypothetical protein